MPYQRLSAANTDSVTAATHLCKAAFYVGVSAAGAADDFAGEGCFF